MDSADEEKKVASQNVKHVSVNRALCSQMYSIYYRINFAHMSPRLVQKKKGGKPVDKTVPLQKQQFHINMLNPAPL